MNADIYVKIPLTLLCHTIEFMESLDSNALNGVDDEFFSWLLSSFQSKARDLDMRASYVRLLCAPDEPDRNTARSAYRKYTDF